MTALATLVSSTIGKKVVMGVTGLIMVGWLTLHMAGNLIVFSGPEAFNHYAHFIQSGFGIEPALLWLMRAFMLAAIGLHIWAAIGLSSRNAGARPVAYQGGFKLRATNYAARFMLIGGIVLLLFIVFHLLHLTTGSLEGIVEPDDFAKKRAYRNVTLGLANPATASVYILANLALAAHLVHGVWSGFQTLGLNHPKYETLKRTLTVLFPLLISGGNILIAVAIVTGLVH